MSLVSFLEVNEFLFLADWKLGGFEFACSLDNEKDLAALQETYAMQKKSAIPTEYVMDENHVQSCRTQLLIL